ncbi:MAG: hypothetical protein WBP12_01785 [Candidatus Saccharimonas sp.]
MIKVYSVKILSFILFSSFLVSPVLSQAAFAETDPNGNIIIDEREVSLSPERVQEKKDEQLKDNLIKVATITVIIIAAGSVLYFNKSKLSKRKKYSRKK